MRDNKNSQLHLGNIQVLGLQQYKTSQAVKNEQVFLLYGSPSSLKHGWQLIIAIIESLMLKEASPQSGYSRKILDSLCRV